MSWRESVAPDSIRGPDYQPTFDVRTADPEPRQPPERLRGLAAKEYLRLLFRRDRPRSQADAP